MKRAFISFDYDNDKSLKEFLVGQSKNPDSPFAISDWSIKDASPTWKSEARRRIHASDVVVVICGQHTHTAIGVATELTIAKEEGTSHFLLAGYAEGGNTKPTSAADSDKMYKWTWPNLKSLIGGSR